MKTSSLVIFTLIVVVFISVLSVWFVPSVQDFMSGNTMWNGIRDFQKDHQVEESGLPSLAMNSGDVLVIIPYLDYRKEELAIIKEFILRGGIVLLLDDAGFGNNILQFLGVSARFEGSILLDPLFCYKNPNMPRIIDVQSAFNQPGIVLNRATVLTGIAEDVVLARSSETSYLDRNNDGGKETGEPEGPFPVTAELSLGNGFIILVSDPSLIINSMRIEGNREFITYLMNRHGAPGAVYMDVSHLTQTPLDTVKADLKVWRSAVSSPYAILGLFAIIFILSVRLWFNKGEIFDRH